MSLRNEVVLVDMNDQEIAVCEKMKAHKESLLHRAFSVFLFRGDRLLLQKRAGGKYHCGGLWTNTCCSHPGAGQDVILSAKERLEEEMGIHTDDLKEVASFVYCARFANGLTEFEYDHVIVGEYDGEYLLDPEEVDEIRWMDLDRLKKDVMTRPEAYTPWFITALQFAIEGRAGNE